MSERISIAELRTLVVDEMAEGDPEFEHANALYLWQVLALVEAVEAADIRSHAEGWCVLCEQLPDDHMDACPLARFDFGDRP